MKGHILRTRELFTIAIVDFAQIHSVLRRIIQTGIWNNYQAILESFFVMKMYKYIEVTCSKYIHVILKKRDVLRFLSYMYSCSCQSPYLVWNISNYYYTYKIFFNLKFKADKLTALF